MKAELLDILAVTQGVACMLAVVAAGIAYGSHWAVWFAIVSLGLAYLATTSLALFGVARFGPADICAIASMVAGFLSIVVLL